MIVLSLFNEILVNFTYLVGMIADQIFYDMFYVFLSYGFGYGRRWKLHLLSNTGRTIKARHADQTNKFLCLTSFPTPKPMCEYPRQQGHFDFKFLVHTNEMYFCISQAWTPNQTNSFNFGSKERPLRGQITDKHLGRKRVKLDPQIKQTLQCLKPTATQSQWIYLSTPRDVTRGEI